MTNPTPTPGKDPEPRSYNLLEPSKHDLVEQDGQPRQARYRVIYDDGSIGEVVQVLFKDGPVVRSCLLEAWPAMQAELAARDQARNVGQQRRLRLKATVEGLVGADIETLAPAQLLVLLRLALWHQGIINDQGVVRPLDEWFR